MLSTVRCLSCSASLVGGDYGVCSLGKRYHNVGEIGECIRDICHCLACMHAYVYLGAQFCHHHRRRRRRYQSATTSFKIRCCQLLIPPKTMTCY